MSSYTTVGNTIKSRFFANWNTTDIAWENRKFDPSTGTAWVRFNIRDGTALQPYLSNSRRQFGVVIVEIYVPDGTGDSTARTYADSISDIYRRIHVDGVRFQEPRAGRASTQEHGWYRWLCEIEFEADTFPGEPSVSVSYPTEVVTQAGHGFNVNDWVYVSSGTWAKARADSASTLAFGVVTEATDTDNFKVTLSHGKANIPSHGHGAAGTKVYLSQDTAGAGTTSAPTSGIKQHVATVFDADHLIVHDYQPESL